MKLRGDLCVCVVFFKHTVYTPNLNMKLSVMEILYTLIFMSYCFRLYCSVS